MDGEYERPCLSCQPCHEKLPMVLSSENVVPAIQVPASIAQYLRSYQRDGVRFLYKQFVAGEGGILADDMGLGKTIQAIAFMAAVLQMKGTKEDKLRHCSNYIRQDIAPNIEVPSVNPVLIVCPASLTDNWNDELQTWGYFKVFKITSANRFELISRAKRKECDALLVTFETARVCIEALNTVDWTCIFVDEVHRIKDTASKVSKALSSFRCKLRYGFTGTPFQNNLKELWCLLNWSNPQALGDLPSFTNDIARQLEHGQRRSATKRDKVQSSLANMQLSALRRKFMLRRTKDILAKHLPQKTDQIVFCKLTPIQEDIYRMIVQLPDVQKLLGLWKDKAKCTKKKAGLLFTFLHLLHKTANHVGLLMSSIISGTNTVAQEVCQQALEGIADLEGIPQKRWPEILANTHMSGKMQVLTQLLPAFLEKGDKILIFSYSTKVLDFIQKQLIKMRYKYRRLDGSTPPDSRFGLVTSFNASPDPSIFLLSTKAGGVGLNITGANVVIIFDPNWNPAHDMQAQDRAYRLGQERNVRVYRLLSTSTIEEFVYLRQMYKQQLGSLSVANKSVRCYFNSVSGDSRYHGELFGIRNLFSFRESERSLTEEIIEKQRNLERKLQLKLEAPSKDAVSGVYVSTCGISGTGADTPTTISNKSGLTQLCEDEFELCEDEPSEEDSGEWQLLNEVEDSGDENVTDDNANEQREENDSKNESIGDLLERTDAVKIVVEHDKIMAPSRVEDFVSDCAIRDVLQRGINSQLPAFECSVASQNMLPTEESEKRQLTSCSLLCRLKFNRFAKSEFLTPYEFATRVIAMSRKQKEALLNKHQKSKQKTVISDEPCSSKLFKRSRVLTETEGGEDTHTVETTHKTGGDEYDPKPGLVSQINTNVHKGKEAHVDKHQKSQQQKVLSQGPNTSKHSKRFKLLTETGEVEESHIVAATNFNCGPKNDQMPKEESIVDTHVHSSSSSSDQPETPSSFEKDVTLFNPSLTKETISLLEQLICNKSKNKKKERKSTISGKHLSSQRSSDKQSSGCGKSAIISKSSKNQQVLSNSRLDECLHTTNGDTESDPSLSGAALLESLLFSDFASKTRPKERAQQELSPPRSLGKQNQSYKVAAISTRSEKKPHVLSAVRVDDSSHLDSGRVESDPPLSGALLLESLLFSDSLKKRRLNKRTHHPSTVNSEASSSNVIDVLEQERLNGVECKFSKVHTQTPVCVNVESKYMSHSQSSSKVLNSDIFKDLNKTDLNTTGRSQYKPEDDIFRQLVKSGKLKLI